MRLEQEKIAPEVIQLRQLDRDSSDRRPGLVCSSISQSAKEQQLVLASPRGIITSENRSRSRLRTRLCRQKWLARDKPEKSLPNVDYRPEDHRPYQVNANKEDDAEKPALQKRPPIKVECEHRRNDRREISSKGNQLATRR